MDYSTRIWNVILNGEEQCSNNVDEHIARSMKDNLIKKGYREVSIIRYETKVKYIYTFKNINYFRESSD